MNKNDGLKLLASAVGLIVALPPFPLGPVAAVALIPFFLFLKQKTFWQSVLGGYLVGFVWATGTVYWIGWATLPGVIGTIFFVPLSLSILGGLLNRLFRLWGDRAICTVPFLWTSMEILMGGGTLGFPWNSLAHTLIMFPQTIQFASITGMYGVTFWLVFLNVLFFEFFRTSLHLKHSLRFLGVAAFLILVPTLHGYTVYSRTLPDSPKIRVSLVQGNIDPYIRWTPEFADSNFVIYSRLTRQAAETHPDLIVWPETAAPCYLRMRDHNATLIRNFADSLKIPLLTGALDYEWIEAGRVQTFNAAFLLTSGRWRMDVYHKRRLVPFSERVPFMERVPFLYNFSRRFTLDIGNFTPGDSVMVFKLPPDSSGRRTPFATLICYDSVFPENVRQFVKAGARFLVIITNDGWFGNTSGPYQHAAIARMRAIENRIWVARCANTGISEIIDPYGRVISKTRLNESIVLTDEIGLLMKPSFYTRYGQGFPIFILTGCGLILLGGIVMQVRDRK